jgi:hypothetical protein
MIYVLVLLLFVNGEITTGRITDFATAEDCKSAQVEMLAQAKAQEVVITANCYPTAKPFVPKKQRDS